MADIIGNQQISASKRSWSESLNAEIGSKNLPAGKQDTHEVFQPKRSRNMPDGDTQMDDYEISNGSLPSCYESGSDSAEKSLRSDGLFNNHISSNEDLNSGVSPTSSGRPPDGYEDPASSSHSTDSNFYDEQEHDSPSREGQSSPNTSPPQEPESSPTDLGDRGSPEGQEDDNDDDDNISTISELSGITIEGWTPVAGPISWVQRQMQAGVDPRTVLKQLVPQDAQIPEDFDDLTLWKIVINLISEPPKRSKLKHLNKLDDVKHLLRTCKKIMVLTGAGVSVSCGIPDFRSRDGIYSRLAVEYPDLPDPQAMFDIGYFRRNPKPFFKFAKEIYPGQFTPSPSHKFIELLESKGKLLRNYTQNIDTLEQVAGIQNVIQCHGSFATATCMVCKYKVDKEAVKEDIMNQVIPKCPKCGVDEEQSIMKPDIVFFGESLPSEFHRQMEIDKDVCDLLIVIGSSLKVRPVALIPNSLPPEVPQILINREPLRQLNFDVELLGDCDVIINELCHQLGTDWESICTMDGPGQEVSRGDIPTPPASRRTSPSCTPHSEDNNSRTSFQVGQEESSEGSPLTNTSLQTSSSTASTEVGTLSKTETVRSVSALQTPQGMAQNDSTASLCSLVGHMSTGNKNEESTPMEESSNMVTSSEKSKEEKAETSSETTKPENKEQEERKTETEERDEKEDKDAKDEEKTQDEINDLEDLRACWEPRIFNLAARLKDGTYLHMPPSRYVFHGAEVYDETSSSDDEEQPQNEDSDSSDSSDSDSNIDSPVSWHHKSDTPTASTSADIEKENDGSEVTSSEIHNKPNIDEIHSGFDVDIDTEKLVAEFTAPLSQSEQDTLSAAMANSS